MEREVTACPVNGKCGLDTDPSIAKTTHWSATGPSVSTLGRQGPWLDQWKAAGKNLAQLTLANQGNALGH